jgi:hypothetical protein
VITASAVKMPDGQIFVGRRHKDAYLAAQTILKSDKPLSGEEGFITSALDFINRREAYRYARKNGQFRRRDTGNHYAGKELFSEDLW